MGLLWLVYADLVLPTTGARLLGRTTSSSLFLVEIDGQGAFVRIKRLSASSQASPCPCGGKAGLRALLDQVALELCLSAKKGGK